mmetsp:Transcript_93583/g.171716  ORF Transcript_93583/g.171716 Transcript_93583/m.171716 type:complete len:344 (+) Transcript_93583:111-1142(+)
MTLKVLSLIAFTYVSSCNAVVHVQRRSKQQAAINAHRAPALTSNSTRIGVLPTALAVMANECKCVFDGVCSCELELKFMNCIRDACASGKCSCDAHHFLGACQAMAATCPEGGLQCSEHTASCVNGAAVTRPGSASNSTNIPETAPLTVTETMIPEEVTYEWHRVPLRQKLMGSAVYVLFGVMVAYIYWKEYNAKMKESYGEKYATTWFRMKRVAGTRSDGFSTSLFDCFHAPQLCALSCCCGCVIWADTVDKVQFNPKLTYWTAFGISFFLMVISPYTAGLSMLAIVILGTITRQLMRKKYQINYYTPKTICEDFLAWWCCSPCAIVQEHCESHYQATQSGW